ncbi:unnamed protein product [Protopolystoma xenopodis]|uniref:SH3 domain-containing protein n=1 Tax=Protopolystoma xenopodis TaxID=117903 RepID=A0A3S5BT09_9PLAT|nr:unnamed protein product [Protopolystoma xenopodis]
MAPRLAGPLPLLEARIPISPTDLALRRRFLSGTLIDATSCSGNPGDLGGANLCMPSSGLLQSLFVRAQVDYDPAKDSQQVAPQRALGIRSGEVWQVVNAKDPDWWQVNSST